MRIDVIGAGVTGVRVVRELVGSAEIDQVVLRSSDSSRVDTVIESLGSKVRGESAATFHGGRPAGEGVGAAVVVLAGVAGDHGARARDALDAGSSVVSLSDDVDDVSALLALDARARSDGRFVAVGAAFAPGLSCLLARLAASTLDHVDEIHVAMVGAGGAACSRQRQRIATEPAREWRDRAWAERDGGSGRELCWFPDPIGARDCYRGALADPMLLVRAFPDVGRVSARMAVDRSTRLLGWLPRRVSPPPIDGDPGAVRVEVRGHRDGVASTSVLGVMDRPSVAAAATAAVASMQLHAESAVGAGGLAELTTDVSAMLRELARRGVKAATFDGVG